MSRQILEGSHRAPSRSMLVLMGAVLVVLFASCSNSAQISDETVVAAAPETVELADLSTCLKINPTGPVTTPASPECLAHGVAIDGFHEGASLMEFAEYQPTNAGPIAAEIRRVAGELASVSQDRTPEDQLIRGDRAAALEVIAQSYDEIEAAWSLRAPDVESSRGGDAAYIEVVTRDLWNTYFLTFFEGPTASADSAHVVERVFVRMRGFEI